MSEFVFGVLLGMAGIFGVNAVLSHALAPMTVEITERDAVTRLFITASLLVVANLVYFGVI